MDGAALEKINMESTMNTIEKILAIRSGKKEVCPGDIVEVDLDHVMSNDACTALAIDVFRNELAAERVFDPAKIIFFMDHYTPSSTIDAANTHNFMREFAREQRLQNVYHGEGICHQLMLENHVLPGQVIIGADSHSCSYGALGALGTGMGSTDVAVAWMTGKIWMKVPETIHVIVNGTWPAGVFAKDLILKVIGDLGASGARYRALYFSGEAIDSLSVAGRTTLCNMAIEAGAKFGFIALDDTTRRFLSRVGRAYSDAYPLVEEPEYQKVIELDVSHMGPQVAFPDRVDDVRDIQAADGTRVDELFLGACTNGSYEDLEIAASILRGRRVSSSVRMLVTPASRAIYLKALKNGLIEIFMESGALVNHPGCSACFGGAGGILGRDEVLLSTANRNFKARVGCDSSSIYLGSPAVIAASAISGQITDPRRYLS